MYNLKDGVVELYTDGSCDANHTGGYAAYLPHIETVICGSEPSTTNNRMELQAVISGLKHIDNDTSVSVYTDSKYVCDSINHNYIGNWISNNWKNSKNTDVKNRDLWEELISLIDSHKEVKFNWVKGHKDNFYNNFCDDIARTSIHL